jgi:hypothetical protein
MISNRRLLFSTAHAISQPCSWNSCGINLPLSWFISSRGHFCDAQIVPDPIRRVHSASKHLRFAWSRMHRCGRVGIPTRNPHLLLERSREQCRDYPGSDSKWKRTGCKVKSDYTYMFMARDTEKYGRKSCHFSLLIIVPRAYYFVFFRR